MRYIVEKHPLTSEEILESMGMFSQELLIIRQHHECFDGSGYPDGLKNKEITIGARILAVADTYDAITSDRPYRIAKTNGQAFSEIINCRGSQFAPEVVEAFQVAYEKNKDLWPLIDLNSSIPKKQEILV